MNPKLIFLPVFFFFTIHSPLLALSPTVHLQNCQETLTNLAQFEGEQVSGLHFSDHSTGFYTELLREQILKLDTYTPRRMRSYLERLDQSTLHFVDDFTSEQSALIQPADPLVHRNDCQNLVVAIKFEGSFYILKNLWY